MIEAIEPRRLLTVTAHLEDHTAFVISDDASDHVGIGMADGHVIVRANDEPVASFAANEVMRIAVNLGAGDDSLITNHLERSMLVHGGPGNDRMQGGMRSDHLFGDEGNDGFKAFGGGEDYINGGPGDDVAFIDHHDHVTQVEHIHFQISQTVTNSFSVVQQIGLSEESGPVTL